MKLRGQSRPSRVWAAPAVVVALLLLAGCGELTPGTAAVVNGTRITNAEVNNLAQAQCVAADRAARSGNSTTMAVSKVRQQSLGLLMDTELSLQYAKAKHIVPEKTLAPGFYNQLKPGITPLPSEARSVLTDVFQSWSQGRAILVTAGSQASGQAPNFTNLDQLAQAGLAERTKWMKNAEITTDARYAPSKEGFPGGGDASVSRAGSDFAKGATSSKADPKFVASLPPSQKCG